jgi:FkbM family methyltransferase
MIRLNDLSRKVSTALGIYRKEGIAGLASAVRDRIDLRLKLHAARKVTSVTLDGCTFELERVPNTPMKLALLQHEYERLERRAVLQHLNPDLPVIELGGCIGVVACITNRKLRDPQLHIVVEANPNAVPLLDRNRVQNRCEFEILNTAIAYGQSSVTFSPAADYCFNSLVHERGQAAVTVPATHLAGIVNRRGFESFTLICDIEGYEYELVLNELDVLRKADTIILETHARLIGEEKTAQLLRKLAETGLHVIDQDSYVVVMSRQGVTHSVLPKLGCQYAGVRL